MQVDDHQDHQILEENGKKIRRRKKNLYNSILQQMEFYFSDANLRKDRFIGQHIKNDPYVELSTFLTFNKISALTNKIEEIATALEKSTILKLSEDRVKVCRITPVEDKVNEDECTIYVERLPEDTQHDWLKEIFSSFGNIDYVSLPKYKHNKRHKGFAFIEFKDQESAQKAITYFESIGCKLPTQMPPNQLVSIATFEPNEQKITETVPDNEEITQDTEPKEEPMEEKIEEKEVENEKVKNKKRKLSPEHEEIAAKKSKPEEDSIVEDEENTETEESKKKRKRKKNKKQGCDFKQLGLQVLSKREWKQLRNKYLNLQRIKMKTLKEHLYKNRHHSYNNDNQTENISEAKAEKTVKETEPRFKYTPGCIVKFCVPEVCNDAKKLKIDIRQHSGVEFVDVQPGKEIGFIRFADDASTKSFIDSSQVPIESVNILEGDEEKEYWDKISIDRENKLKKAPSKKVRGREKLLKKAEQELGKHIRFEN